MRGPAAVAASFDQLVLDEDPVIEVAADGQIQIELRKGVLVTYGDGAQIPDKALAIAGILSWADREHADVITMDVRVPHAPTAELERHGVPIRPGIIPVTPPCDQPPSDDRNPGRSPSPVPQTPSHPEAVKPCAKHDEAGSGPADDTAGGHFLAELERHTRQTRELFLRLLDRERVMDTMAETQR